MLQSIVGQLVDPEEVRCSMLRLCRLAATLKRCASSPGVLVF